MILSKVIAVRVIGWVKTSERSIALLEGLPTMRCQETGERDLVLHIHLYRSGLSDALHHVSTGNDRLDSSHLTLDFVRVFSLPFLVNR